jgi:hypothetical protein
VLRKRHRQQEIGRSRYAVLLALLVFAALAALPAILGALHLRFELGAPTTSRGVPLLPAPSAPPRVALSAVAQPIDPGLPPATPAAVNGARQAAAVAAEDSRIKVMVHDAASVYQPEVISVPGSLPTLVLTAGSRPYTYADLVQYGALVLLPHHAGLLLDNVFVSTNASLDLGMPALRTLYLDSSVSGFTSIVSWGGSLTFRGTARQPLTVIGWDRKTGSPAPSLDSGRSYIREVAGRMTLANVRVSDLGFWSGRTGGVAWTGSTGSPSTGGATASTFTDETYGAFVTRGRHLTFHDDLFEFNQLDGLHIHRNTTGVTVTDSSAVRNLGNGFLVDRATTDTVLDGDVSQHNAGAGFLVDGRSLVTGASASGGSVSADTGTYVESSAALGDLRGGIVLDGGVGTVVKGDEVCARVLGIAIRDGASGTIVTGSDVRCGPRAALEIGPLAPQTVVSGNTLVDARIGLLVRSSGPVEADNNKIIGATVFGITARGQASRVTGQGNVISGTGFRAVDARADASAPALTGTQDAGWTHHLKLTVWSYLLFHPLALLWLSILAVVLLGELWSRSRRMPPHPYPASTRWRATPPPPAAAPAARGPAGGPGPERRLVPAPAAPGLERRPVPAASGSGPQRGPVPAASGPVPPAWPRSGGSHRLTAPPPPGRPPAAERWPEGAVATGRRHQIPERPAMAGHHGGSGAPGRADDWLSSYDERFESTVPLPRTEI